MAAMESSNADSTRTSTDSSNVGSSGGENASSTAANPSPSRYGHATSDEKAELGFLGRDSPASATLDESTDASGDEDEEEEDFTPPIFARSYSSPLPARVKSFQKPSRLSSTSTFTTPPLLSHVSEQSVPSTEVVTPSALQTLSAELSDSLQSAIQTLLHLSPPHLLDNAKEQYSGCTVQLPTTSLSALLTAMKGLNYLSANFAALCQDAETSDLETQRYSHSGSSQLTATHIQRSNSGPARQDTGITGILDAATSAEDFDVGELLQSTADLLSGQAAQAGVELVLFHGDVGIKHVSVHGDGEGLGYALSYILRQIINVCEPGDTLEFGLQLVPQSPSLTPRINHPLTAAELATTKSSMGESDTGTEPGMTLQTNRISGNGPLLCTFDIVHNCTGERSRRTSSAETPRAEAPLQMTASALRRPPDIDSLLCRRILRHVNATLCTKDLPEDPSYFSGSASRSGGKTYEISVLLARGEPIAEPTILSVEEEAQRQPFPQLQLSREPTLDELSRFTETLRGKRVEVHASFQSVFARHLSSYLAAWGMEISHFPIEEESAEASAKSAEWREEMNAPAITSSGIAGSLSSTLNPIATDNMNTGSISGERFIIIDDDVTVLKKQLLLLRAETPIAGSRTRNLKRPTLSTRTRSTPQVRQLGHNLNLGRLPPGPSASNSVIIHFTSLSKYNHVRDVVTSILAISPGSYFQPEVMVIPKPVGPRRFLTALHTAVNRPIVDPYFTPIATSPRSPGGYFAPKDNGSSMPYEASGLGAPGAISPGVDLGPRHTSAPWPNIDDLPIGGGSALQAIANTPGIVSTPVSEYFQDRTSQSDPSSRASGIVLSSPDGRAYGMFFEPQIRLEGSRRNSGSNKIEKRRTPLSRSVSAATVLEQGADSVTGGAGSPSRRLSSLSAGSTGDGESRRLSGLQTVEEDESHSTEADVPAVLTRSGSIRKKTLTRPQEPTTRERTGSGSTTSRPRAPSAPSVVVPKDDPESEPVNVANEKTDAEVAAEKKKDTIAKRKALAKKSATGKAKDTMVVPPINVLIVEDNPINQNILSTYLRKKKIKHQSAFDGREAVEKWRTGNFHIILMDIQLPVMNGLDATKAIREMERSSNVGFFPATPTSESHRTLSPAIETTPGVSMRSSVIIVALTASSLMQDRVEALAAGCNDFLTKPVSLKWLETKIIEWGCMQALIDFEGWRRWRTADQPQNRAAESARLAVQNSGAANARNIASRLKIAPKARSNPGSGDEEKDNAGKKPEETAEGFK
ncbi:hypothetical protein QFC22_002725 [Naganishia vaughanmartiniae]|uniref:Uncharacterized protein n=1 Tax=Naganishia vaughanmartiniae TaxID=1424756 RepID=A0ACC2XCK6_9TREE|nr:hypothetical protein QFC22_002725 [Naganishia vaughanmartiniae]